MTKANKRCVPQISAAASTPVEHNGPDTTSSTAVRYQLTDIVRTRQEQRRQYDTNHPRHHPPHPISIISHQLHQAKARVQQELISRQQHQYDQPVETYHITRWVAVNSPNAAGPTRVICTIYLTNSTT